MAKDNFEDAFDFEESGTTTEGFSFEEKGDVSDFIKDLPRPEENFSGLESLAGGIADSASLGFTDELTGAIAAPIDYAATRLGAFDAEGVEAPREGMVDLYKKYRDIQRNRMKDMQQEDPGTSLAGNLAGGFAIPGGTMAKGLGKTAGLAKNMIQASKGGAALGAGYGAGTSEADVLGGDIKDLAGDIGSSAAIGASLGPAMPLIGAGAKQVGKIPGAIGKTDVGKIFKAYLKGEDLAGNVQKQFNKLKDIGGQTTSELSKRTKQEAKELEAFMQKATNDRKTVDSTQIISDMDELIEDLPDSVSKNKLIKKINSYVETQGLSETDSPIEVFKLFKDLKQNMAPSGKDLGERRVFAEMDRALKEGLQEGVESLPESYSKMSDNLAMIEAITGKSPSKFQSTKDKVLTRERMGNLLLEKSPEMKAKTKLLDIMEGFEDPLKLGKQVKGLKEIAPDLAKRIEDEVPDIAEKIRLGMSIDPNELKTISPDLRSQIAAQFGGGIGIVRKGSAVAGKGAKAIVDFTKDMTKSLTSASPDKLNSIVNKLSQKGGVVADNLARGLGKLVDKDRRDRQAILFGIMQNPAYREEMESIQRDFEVEDESR